MAPISSSDSRRLSPHLLLLSAQPTSHLVLSFGAILPPSFDSDFSHFEVLLSACFPAVTQPGRWASPRSLNPHQAFVQTSNWSSLDYLLQESFPRLCCQNCFPSHKPEYFEKHKITSCRNRVKVVHDSRRPKLLAVWPLFLCLTLLSTLCLLPFRPNLPRVPATGFCFNCGFF